MSQEITSGSLREAFANFPPRTKILATPWYRGVYRDARRISGPPSKDVRGPIVPRIETALTFLTSSKVDNLIGDYLAGASVQDLAQGYGVHRAMVFAHLRWNTPRRSLGLDVDDSAEAVRLFRVGV